MTTKMSQFGSLADRFGVEMPTARVVAKVAHVIVDERELGLLVGWRHSPSGWEGCVATATAPGQVGAQWLPSGRIRPAAQRDT